MSILEGSIETITIPRNYFYRPEKHGFTMEAGYIYPYYVKILMPNDLVKISNNIVIRQQPTINPSFSEFKLTIRHFVVALRNVDKNIYRFISGFKQYSTKTKYEDPLPRWDVGLMKFKRDSEGNPTGERDLTESNRDVSKCDIGTLWDTMGMPAECIPDDNHRPIDHIRRAYNYIYDLYFRNQTFEDSILIDNDPELSENEDLLMINWDKDYFTTGLPFQQLGEPMALPIAGNTKATWSDENIKNKNIVLNSKDSSNIIGSAGAGATIVTNPSSSTALAGTHSNLGVTNKLNSYYDYTFRLNSDLTQLLNNNTVDMSQISSVLISEIRKAFALQMYAEMMARGGIRDNELLLMMWGTAPSDETLGRPYYLGSSKYNILTSEVLQTSSSTNDSALGDMGGSGLGVGHSNEITYHAKEFCVLISLAYIKPETIYGGQGIPKELCMNSRFDFPIPVLSHISEQPVEASEVLCASKWKLGRHSTGELYKLEEDTTAEKYNKKIFSYRPVYDNWRFSTNRISGLFRKSIVYKQAGSTDLQENANLYNWTEARFFDIRDGYRPAANNDFFKVKLDNRNYRVVDGVRERAQFMVWIETEGKYWRALSEMGTPGRLDHII